MEIQKQFEAWYKDHHHEQIGSFDGECYANGYQHTLWVGWQAAKASVVEGFVLVSAEQLSKWGHMANYAEQYGCPECFESRGYAHTLSCEINEYFAIEAQEQSHD